MDSHAHVPVALTIAGSDSGGGAGIQADLKTFHQWGVFGTSVLTAVTAQNTLGVQKVHAVPAAVVEAQVHSVATDLAPLAFKSGMLANTAVVRAVGASIRRHDLARYVLDPVMVATSGDTLLEPDAVTAVRDELVPLAALVAIVPESAVAAALVIIAATTVGLVREIEWDDLDTAVPALVTMAGMPLTFSIADGLAMGLVSYSALKILRGKGLEVSWLVHVLAVVFIARYIFIA